MVLASYNESYNGYCSDRNPLLFRVNNKTESFLDGNSLFDLEDNVFLILRVLDLVLVMKQYILIDEEKKIYSRILPGLKKNKKPNTYQVVDLATATVYT